ncbi:MAG: hypothetical protein LBE95_02670 [Holosporaceae bacterium]|jgi:hypothetical protein|nr:hypothetical protein [Holosporaceae bacterium]
MPCPRQIVGISPDASSILAPNSTNSNNIYPGLTINAGETKMILEVMVKHRNFSGGTSATEDLGQRLFGLKILKLPELKPVAGASHGVRYYSVVIFTPKPGLFDGTAPK